MRCFVGQGCERHSDCLNVLLDPRGQISMKANHVVSFLVHICYIFVSLTGKGMSHSLPWTSLVMFNVMDEISRTKAGISRKFLELAAKMKSKIRLTVNTR